MIFLWVLIGIVFLFLLSSAYAGFVFAPWLPTRRKDIERLKKLADLKPGQIFYDLGCGTSQVVMEMSKVKGSKAKGVELVLPLFLYCQLKKIISKAQAKFYWKNLFKMDISDADVIYLFGTPRTLQGKIQKKIWAECKAGTKVFSYAFAFDNFYAHGVDKPKDQLSIYQYIVH